MAGDNYKELTRQFIEDYRMSFEHFPAFAPDGRYYLAGSPAMDLAGVSQAAKMLAIAFPDLTAKVDDLVAEGNKVVCRWTATATHTGELMGIPPTGRTVVFSGICIELFEGNQIVEHHVNLDQFGMLVQLGVIPQPAHA